MKYQLIVVAVALMFFQCKPGNEQPEFSTITLKGSESMHETFDALKKDFETIQDTIKLNIEGGGSKTGLLAIKNKEVDIGMSSYPFDLSKELGPDHDVVEQVVAYDGIILINNENNMVKQLTDQQISAIYNGQITDWSQLGGHPGKIRLISRDQNSGTQKFFSSYFKVNQLPPGTRIARDNDEIVKEVMTNKDGIGYVGFAYFKVGVNDISLPPSNNKIDTFYHPTVKNLSLGLYPLKRGLRIYYNDERTVAVNAFLHYLKSVRAQEIIENHGLVSKSQEIYYNASVD